MEQEAPKIKLVPHSLVQVFKLKRSITDALDITYQEIVLDHEGLQEVVNLVHDKLPPGIERGCVFDSLRHLAGVRLSSQLLKTEAWRIAGNVRSLRAGTPVPPWRIQRFEEWVPLQVADCKVMRTPKRKKLGVLLTFRVLAGRSCTELFDAFWAKRFCKFFSYHVGFGAPYSDTRYDRMEELVRLRVYGLLKPAGDGFDGRSLLVNQYFVNSALEKYNKGLIKKRARIGFRCPKNYHHPCHRCHVGYDQCLAAVHPRTYEIHECDVCGKEKHFDPMWVALGVCVDCQRKRDIAAQQETS